jgi:hypothetical protein
MIVKQSVGEAGMDRNIITAEAAAAHNRVRAAEFRQAIQRYAGEAGGREASLAPGTLGGELPIDVQKPDTWYDRITKYVPAEAISAYLALEKSAQAAHPKTLSEQAGWSEQAEWLALALAVSLLFNVAYLMRIAKVKSWVQVGVSSLALVAYVYANGGVFSALGIAYPIAQLFVLVITALLLTFFEPLPSKAAVNHN